MTQPIRSGHIGCVTARRFGQNRIPAHSTRRRVYFGTAAAFGAARLVDQGQHFFPDGIGRFASIRGIPMNYNPVWRGRRGAGTQQADADQDENDGFPHSCISFACLSG